MLSKKTRERAVRLRRLTAAGFLYGFTALLAIAFLMALVSGAFGGALILLATIAVAIWRIRARQGKTSAPTGQDVEADLDDLQIAGWTIRHDVNTPNGVLEHIAASPRDQIAFAISEQPGQLESEHLTEIAQVAAWIHYGGLYPGVVPVLLAAALDDVEVTRGPVLVLSPDKLLTALQDAATEAERLNGDPDAPPTPDEQAQPFSDVALVADPTEAI